VGLGAFHEARFSGLAALGDFNLFSCSHRGGEFSCLRPGQLAGYPGFLIAAATAPLWIAPADFRDGVG